MTAQPARVTEDVLTMDAWRCRITERISRGERFAGLHATAVGERVRLTAVLADETTLGLLDTEVADRASYPALTAEVPAAAWYEREIADTFGLTPLGHPRSDPLVLPLGDDRASRPRPGSGGVMEALTPDEAVFPAPVLGHGVFTIPYGPVRSGVFESVEYRIETPGEDIPHVDIRVFAKHRGIERRFEGLDVEDGSLLAERVEGIASVAHALAYCHAIESIEGARPPRAAAMVRVVHAELERVANHLDVAMKLCDAAGFSVGIARFGLHKERVLRLVGAMCGNRFGRGVIVPGGVSALPALPPDELQRRLAALETAIEADALPLMRTPSFLDRLRGTGPLDPQLARAHGALGPIGRASGFDDDDRRARPYDGYRLLETPALETAPQGDVMARMRVRWEELSASFALARGAIEATDGADGPTRAPVEGLEGRGAGWAEAPQGEVAYVVEVEAGRIVRCKPRSASFHNLVLFHDVFAGDVFTDFPFIEASFGLSIAGASG